jgi:hypothetical protein
MQVRTRLLIAGLAVIALLAAAARSEAATAGKLLSKYQPVTYFTGDEDFRPTAIDSFVEDSTLERFNPACNCFVIVNADPTPTSLPSSGAGWRLNQQPCSPEAGVAGEACYATAAGGPGGPQTVYGRVLRTDNRVVVQYWYFYYDDFYSYTPTVSNFIWQEHEGDWEVVNVVLDADEDPLFVGYSQHCLGTRRSWAKTPRWSGRHPIVFVARGSHANYFTEGTHPWNSTCLPASVLAFFTQAGLQLPSDYTGTASSSGPAAFASDTTGIVKIADGSPSWVSFPGTWGELQYLHADLLGPGASPSGTSPVGPARHAVWSDPVTTMASWPRD